MFLGAKFPVDLETWSRGFHRVVRWVKLQTNTRGRARSIALACRYGVKVFLGPDGAFGGDPEKPWTLVRGVVTISPVVLSALKGLLSPDTLSRLTPLGGFEARVYTDEERVYKVYRPGEAHLAALEAERMARAGLGSFVLGVAQVEGQGVLVIRHFPGKPFSPEAFTSKALAALSHLFLSLHRLPEPGYVEREELSERLERFAESLGSVPEALSLIKALMREVAWVAGVEKRFCHRDAWAGNLLLKTQENPSHDDPEVLLVDWVRSGGDDPARDLALLKTGSLDLLGEKRAREALFRLVQFYPKEVRERLAFYVPLTYLHDLHWFRTKKPEGFLEALADKLPRALSFFQDCFPLRNRAC